MGIKEIAHFPKSDYYRSDAVPLPCWTGGNSISVIVGSPVSLPTVLGHHTEPSIEVIGLPAPAVNPHWSLLNYYWAQPTEAQRPRRWAVPLGLRQAGPGFLLGGAMAMILLPIWATQPSLSGRAGHLQGHCQLHRYTHRSRAGTLPSHADTPTLDTCL